MKYPAGWSSDSASQSISQSSADLIHSKQSIGIGWLIAHTETFAASREMISEVGLAAANAVISVFGQSIPSREHRHPSRNPDVIHRKHFRIRDDVHRAFCLSEDGILTRLRLAQVVRWVQAVIAKAHTTHLLEDIAQVQRERLQVELQVLFQRCAVEGWRHSASSGIGSFRAGLIEELREEGGSGSHGRSFHFSVEWRCSYGKRPFPKSMTPWGVLPH